MAMDADFAFELISIKTCAPNLSEIINNDCHVIFLSTDKVYKNSKSIFKENDIAQSIGEYAKNKNGLRIRPRSTYAVHQNC